MTPKKYRKKPVVIEALQFDGTNADDIVEFCGGVLSFTRSQELPIINTLEGDMTAQIGDFIIKGVQGEFYPVKPDIFAATYEAVNQ